MSMAKEAMQRDEERRWRDDPEAYEAEQDEMRRQADDDADTADWQRWEDEEGSNGEL